MWNLAPGNIRSVRNESANIPFVFRAVRVYVFIKILRMNITGLLTKMTAENGTPIQYFLNFESETIPVNPLLGQKIKIRFNHYQCLECGRKREVFAMGYCKNCYFTSPYAGQWIVRPELSAAHLGEADRNLAVEAELQLQPHIVYLANSGGVKVGVTRKSQVPTRWIDQGAEYAIKLAETENRYEAGLIEVALKQHLADKTNYRKMLKENAPYEDLATIKNKVSDFVPVPLRHYILGDNQIHHLEYPVQRYPSKVNSVNLKKIPELEGILTGIKGQYLMFDNNDVFNVRSHEGFVVDLEINS